MQIKTDFAVMCSHISQAGFLPRSLLLAMLRHSGFKRASAFALLSDLCSSLGNVVPSPQCRAPISRDKVRNSSTFSEISSDHIRWMSSILLAPDAVAEPPGGRRPILNQEFAVCHAAMQSKPCGGVQHDIHARPHMLVMTHPGNAGNLRTAASLREY